VSSAGGAPASGPRERDEKENRGQRRTATAGRTAGRSLYCRKVVSEALSSTHRTVVEPEHLHIATTSHSSTLHLPRAARGFRVGRNGEPCVLFEALEEKGAHLYSLRPSFAKPCFASFPVFLLSLALHYPVSPLRVALPSFVSSTAVFRRRERREDGSD
jgi:hypothetical protein